MQPSSLRHAAFFGLFLLAIIFGVLLLWPFLKIVVVAAALSVVLFPIYHFLLRRIAVNNKWFASLLTIILFLVIICGPLALIGTLVFRQTQLIYQELGSGGTAGALANKMNTLVHHYFPAAGFDIGQQLSAAIGSITSKLGTIAGFIFSTIFSLFLTILAMFYFLKDGAALRKSIVHYSPLSDASMEKILTTLSHAVQGVIKGYLLVGLVQGSLLGIGLWIFGVPHAALWGLFGGVASLVPTVGTALISVPAVLFLFSIGRDGAAIGLAIWAAALVGTIDNLLNPIIVGRKVDIHPMFVLFSVLGGVALMGPVGILIGPLVVSFMYALVAVYSSEMKE
ncbi:MAG TPA: AI-2E family transporter [Candidatus Paceibacterota bacterium]|nr:AI-2E family transporter [Candidatus Paceibacterota bacterium]